MCGRYPYLGLHLQSRSRNRPHLTGHKREFFAEVAPLVAHATSVRIDDDAALLRFTNRWGLLGVADPLAGANQSWDSVMLTRAELTIFQRLALWLGAMKSEEWSSLAIPPSSELKTILGIPLARCAQRGQRREWARHAFVDRLNERLARVVTRWCLEPGGHGFEPALKPCCLADLLYLTLYQHAGRDDTVPRCCNGCGGIFFVSATNHKRTHCGPRCKNTAKLRRWRQRQRVGASSPA